MFSLLLKVHGAFLKINCCIAIHTAILMVSTSFFEAETFTVFMSASVISDWSTFTEVKFEVLLKNLSRVGAIVFLQY